MKKTIINKVKNCPIIEWQILKTYEFNQVKENLRDVTKLKNSIVNAGFNSPFYVWADHKFVIDGTGRFLALQQLEIEGFVIPELPVVEIQAETLKQAKKVILQINSQYGKISQDSLSTFLEDEFEEVELSDLQSEINLIELDLKIESLKKEGLADDIDFDDVKSNNDREVKEKTQLVTCPHCEGKFNMQV